MQFRFSAIGDVAHASISRMKMALGSGANLIILAVGLNSGYTSNAMALDDEGASGTPGEEVASGEAPALAEIIVTAQKRQETVQQTPLAISAFSGDALREQNVTDITQLNNMTPNVSVNVSNGVTRITIRGIGVDDQNPGGESNVAYHIDGVYEARPESQADSFFDVNRVEIVRGPQGTLYGRNATGGAINVVTNDPTDTLSGYGQVTFGNYNNVIVESAIGGPIASGVEGRLAVQSQNHSGYGTQGNGLPLDDLDTKAVRLKLKLDPRDDLSIVLSGDYFNQQDASGQFRYLRNGDAGTPPFDVLFGGILASDPFRNTTNTFPNREWKNDGGFGSTVTWNESPGFTLTSVTGVRSTNFHNQYSYGSTNANTANLGQSDKASQESEELRASGDVGHFSYVTGLYYFHEDEKITATAHQQSELFGILPNYTTQGYAIEGELVTVSQAAFGQLTYQFTPQWALDVGERYSHEKKAKYNEGYEFSFVPFDPAAPPVYSGFVPYAQTTNSASTPKVTARYSPTRDVHLYATYAQGFKSGGFSLGTLAPAYAPQKIKDYEGGIKADWLDGRLRTDLSGFYYKYTNLQVEKTLTVNGSPIDEIVSAGSAKLYGMEASIVAAPIPAVRLNLDAGLIHSEYLVFSTVDATRPELGLLDLRGNHLSQAPKYTIGAGGQYTWAESYGTITLRGEGHFTGLTYYTPFNTPDYTQAPYHLFDGYLTFESPSNNWSVSLFAKNIGNVEYASSLIQGAAFLGSPVIGNAGPPRTFGVKFGVQL
jgi:iron complex outermembrane receptor protein